MFKLCWACWYLHTLYMSGLATQWSRKIKGDPPKIPCGQLQLLQHLIISTPNSRATPSGSSPMNATWRCPAQHLLFASRACIGSKDQTTSKTACLDAAVQQEKSIIWMLQRQLHSFPISKTSAVLIDTMLQHMVKKTLLCQFGTKQSKWRRGASYTHALDGWVHQLLVLDCIAASSLLCSIGFGHPRTQGNRCRKAKRKTFFLIVILLSFKCARQRVIDEC